MIAIVFYLLANIAYFALLTPAEMLESSAVASVYTVIFNIQGIGISFRHLAKKRLEISTMQCQQLSAFS